MHYTRSILQLSAIVVLGCLPVASLQLSFRFSVPVPQHTTLEDHITLFNLSLIGIKTSNWTTTWDIVSLFQSMMTKACYGRFFLHVIRIMASHGNVVVVVRSAQMKERGQIGCFMIFVLYKVPREKYNILMRPHIPREMTMLRDRISGSNSNNYCCGMNE